MHFVNFGYFLIKSKFQNSKIAEYGVKRLTFLGGSIQECLGCVSLKTLDQLLTCPKQTDTQTRGQLDSSGESSSQF